MLVSADYSYSRFPFQESLGFLSCVLQECQKGKINTDLSNDKLKELESNLNRCKVLRVG